jgi:hypothetical protein
MGMATDDFNSDSPHERKNVQDGEQPTPAGHERSQDYPEQPCQMHHQDGSGGSFVELVFHFPYSRIATAKRA